MPDLKPGSRLRLLPNLISAARLAAAPFLVLLAVNHAEAAFTWLLIAALVSDIADGWIARALDLHSNFGAMLDSVADVTTLACASYGIWVFHPEVYANHAFGCGAVLAGWIFVCVVALIRYRRLSSFHTYASKAAGYALGFFIAALFLFGFVAALFYAAVAISVASSVEELLLLYSLPEWRSDVRGLWWIVRDQRADLTASSSQRK